MIVDEGGRFKSVRTSEDYATLFQRELDALTDEEREIAFLAIEDLMREGSSPIVELSSKDMYRTPPVSMEVFLNDEYFLGKSGKSLFPEVKKTLYDVFEGQYSTAILGGSLGGGKTTSGCISILRMVYEVSCLKSPYEIYNISPVEPIFFPCVAATEDVAEVQIVNKIRGYIEESPYFQREFKPVNDTAARGIEFPNRIVIPPGVSTESGIIGGTSFGCFIDEANFFKGKRVTDGGKSKSNIKMIYEGIKRRIESRFMSRGKLPGLIIIASSKQTVHSFTEEIIRKSVGDPRTFVKEASVYEVTPKERYSGETFRVALGNETRSSRILSKDEPDPDAMKVIEVPVEFREAFEEDTDAAIMDISGYSTVAVTPFISRRDKLSKCIDNRIHPFNHEIWDQTFPGKVDWHKIARIRTDGAWEPLLNPKSPRHIHLDLSKTGDKTGLCISHISHYIPVQRIGSDQEEMAPVFKVDFALSIQPPAGGEISYTGIRKLIYEFSKHGFFIKMVSADSYQSAAVLQLLKEQGYTTKVVSVDLLGPYDILKNAIYEERVKFYNYPQLTKELRELQKNWKTGKVDHPDQGEKDIADALCGTVMTLSQTSYGITDQPMTSANEDVLSHNEDSWILDDPNMIWVQDAPPSESKPEWRQNAEKVIEENEKTNNDWKSNFQAPFIVG